MQRISRLLVVSFERVHRERMTGLPILHPGLSVAVVGARAWQQDWLGMLLTPWCMNLVIVPGPGSAFVPGAIGSKQLVEFPAGGFEFIASAEEGVGTFAACSMFSPMHEFADQAATVSTAREVMAALFASSPAPPLRSDCASADGERRPISRRDLLRGRLHPRD